MREIEIESEKKLSVRKWRVSSLSWMEKAKFTSTDAEEEEEEKSEKRVKDMLGKA